MAGGTWVAQNKVRPGVYIDIYSQAKPLSTVGERGTTTMALALSWGAPKTIHTIYADSNLFDMLGYDITAPQLLLVREALKRVKTLLLYRLNAGTKATAILGSLTATAKYGGLRGNDIKVIVQANLDDNTKFDVNTTVSNEEVDSQTVADIAGLVPNIWVDFSGVGSLAANPGVVLSGGADGSGTNQDHTDYLAVAELYDFNTMALVSADATLKSVYVSFAKRLRDGEGRKIQLVVENYPTADFEGVISVKNGVALTDGTTLTAEQATAWVAAATAGAEANQSLTYQAYDDALDAVPRHSGPQIIAALLNGEFVFVHNGGKAIVEQDINTFTSFTPTKGKQFSKNRPIRVMDGLANDWKAVYETYYIGKVDNDDDGRNLFRKDCIKLAENYQGMGAIQNFDAQTDIVVSQGEDSDAVYVGAYIQTVDSIEKVYMKVQVR